MTKISLSFAYKKKGNLSVRVIVHAPFSFFFFPSSSSTSRAIVILLLSFFFLHFTSPFVFMLQNIHGKPTRYITVKEHRSNIHIKFPPYWLHPFTISEHVHHIFYLIFTQRANGVICHMPPKFQLICGQHSNTNFHK